MVRHMCPMPGTRRAEEQPKQIHTSTVSYYAGSRPPIGARVGERMRTSMHICSNDPINASSSLAIALRSSVVAMATGEAPAE